MVSRVADWFTLMVEGTPRRRTALVQEMSAFRLSGLNSLINEQPSNQKFPLAGAGRATRAVGTMEHVPLVFSRLITMKVPGANGTLHIKPIPKIDRSHTWAGTGTIWSSEIGRNLALRLHAKRIASRRSSSRGMIAK